MQKVNLHSVILNGHCVICPSFLDLRILIAPLLSSKSSCTGRTRFKMDCIFFIHVDISLYTDKLSWLLANYSESYLLMLCVWPDQELKLLSSTWVEITLEAGCTNHPGGRGLWYNMFYTEISKTEVSSSWTYMDGNSTPSYSHLMPNGSRTDLWLSIMKVRRYKDVIKIIVHQDRKTKT
jgi:hypothetical protein